MAPARWQRQVEGDAVLMTWQDFRNELVLPYGRQTGVSAFDVSDTVAINGVISRGLKDFSRYTYCLFDEKFDFSTTANVFEYSTGLLFQVLAVVLDGTPLRRTDGRIGVESLSLLRDGIWADWHKMTATKPVRAVAKPNKKLLLIPKPDAIYNGHMTGWREHADYVSDSTQLEIEESWLDVAAMWCAQKLAYPAMTGQAVFGQIFNKDRKVAEAVRMYRHENLRSMIPSVNAPPRVYRSRRFW